MSKAQYERTVQLRKRQGIFRKWKAYITAQSNRYVRKCRGFKSTPEQIAREDKAIAVYREVQVKREAKRKAKMVAQFLKEQERKTIKFQETLEVRIERNASSALRQDPVSKRDGAAYEKSKASIIQNHQHKPQQHSGTVRRCNTRLRISCKEYLGNKCLTPGCKAIPNALEFHHLNNDGGEHRRLFNSPDQAHILRDWIKRGRPTKPGQKFALGLACSQHHRVLTALARVKRNAESNSTQLDYPIPAANPQAGQVAYL